jgi:hypothetical protein
VSSQYKFNNKPNGVFQHHLCNMEPNIWLCFFITSLLRCSIGAVRSSSIVWLDRYLLINLFYFKYFGTCCECIGICCTLHELFPNLAVYVSFYS